MTDQTPTPDIWSLTPQQATERLAAMSTAAPAVDPTTPANVAAMTPHQAALKLDELLKNSDFQKRYLTGDGPAAKQYHDLAAKKAEAGADRLDNIVRGTAEVRELETVIDGELSTQKLIQAAEHMKNFGLNEATVKQALTSAPVSRAEYDAVKTLRGELMADKDFTSALLAGNPVAVREFTLMNTIVANGYAEVT
jgi:hypothetical protein